MSLLQQAMQGVAQRAQQPTLLEQMQAQRQQKQAAEADMKLKQMQTQKLGQELAQKQSASQILKSLPTNASNMEKAQMLANAGLDDYASMFAGLADKESLAAKRQADVAQKDQQLALTEEENESQQRRRREQTKLDRRNVALRGDELSLSMEREDRITRFEESANTREEAARRQAEAKWATDAAADRFSAVNKAIGMSGVELVNKGTDKKPSYAPSLSPYNLNLVRSSLTYKEGEAVDQLAINDEIKEKFAVIPRDSVDVKGQWDNLPNKRDLMVPRDFIAIAKRNGVDEGDIVRTFVQVENDLSSPRGELSVETAKQLIKLGITEKEFNRIFMYD